jgi:hypothetical protein
MTRKSQERGLKAEERVLSLAETLGDARGATSKEDYSQKTDIVFKGQPIQVSVSAKSKRQRRALRNRGIENIPGGEDIADETILGMLRKLLS